MAWAKRVAENLLPLSREKSDLKTALKEWFYNGEAYDLGTPSANCELCDHPDIKYQFGILNKFTNEKLLVGSECITKFEIDVVDEFENVLEKKAGVKKLNQDRNKLITAAALKRVIRTLLLLGSTDNYFSDKIESLIDYYKDRNGFTPKQLLFVIRGFMKNKIQYRKSDFRLRLRRNREKDQLVKMGETEIQDLWPCLSKSQQNLFLRLRRTRNG